MKMRLTMIIVAVFAIGILVNCGGGEQVKEEKKAEVKLNCTALALVKDGTVEDSAAVKDGDSLVLTAMMKDTAANKTCPMAADAIVTWTVDKTVAIDLKADPKDPKKAIKGLKATIKIAKAPAKEAKVSISMMKDGKPVTAMFKITKAAAAAPADKKAPAKK